MPICADLWFQNAGISYYIDSSPDIPTLCESIFISRKGAKLAKELAQGVRVVLKRGRKGVGQNWDEGVSASFSAVRLENEGVPHWGGGKNWGEGVSASFSAPFAVLKKTIGRNHCASWNACTFL